MKNMKNMKKITLILAFVMWGLFVGVSWGAEIVSSENSNVKLVSTDYHGQWNVSTRVYQVIMKTAGNDPAFSYNKDMAYFYWQFGIKKYAIYYLKAMVYRLDVNANGKTWKVAEGNIGKMNFNFPKIDLWEGYWTIAYQGYDGCVGATMNMPGFYKVVGAISKDGVEISKITSYFDVY